MYGSLKIGYVISGVITLLLVTWNYIWTLPDGKLHVVFCNVGQGDSAYIRLPDGRDILVDGGPNNSLLSCLGKHMPFWDRRIDLVILTHAQKDHLGGLSEVVKRYGIGMFVHSGYGSGEAYAQLWSLLDERHVARQSVNSGSLVKVSPANIAFIWPKKSLANRPSGVNVLGEATTAGSNDNSLVFIMNYGAVDILFTGDADNRVNGSFTDVINPADGRIEILKVPHHGSKNGLNPKFLNWVKPEVAVISVGKNSYGHPAPEIIDNLQTHKAKIFRTDVNGNIELVIDGVSWRIIPERKKGSN